MKYLVEESLANFKFWSGAISTANNLTLSEFERVEQAMEESKLINEWTEDEINNFFWFDDEKVYELAGKTRGKINYYYDDDEDEENTDVTYFVYEDGNEDEHVFESKSIEECRQYCRDNYVLWDNV